eukprot:3100130-Rhodomonas_salina.1
MAGTNSNKSPLVVNPDSVKPTSTVINVGSEAGVMHEILLEVCISARTVWNVISGGRVPNLHVRISLPVNTPTIDITVPPFDGPVEG